VEVEFVGAFERGERDREVLDREAGGVKTVMSRSVNRPSAVPRRTSPS